jgi:hypothetical protein
MKKILSTILAVFMTGVVAGTATVALFPAGDTYAGSFRGCDDDFMGLRPWFKGLIDVKEATPASGHEQKCVIMQPNVDNNDDMAWFVWTIILNISFDLALMVGYVALGFVIYGGFTYIMSNGEAQKIVQAKKTIMNALIGLIIAILATVIVNTILLVLGSAAS